MITKKEKSKDISENYFTIEELKNLYKQVDLMIDSFNEYQENNR